MGFTKFWSGTFSQDPELNRKINEFKNTVTIFTNSVYDTSTIFSNEAFSSLFECLEVTLNEAKNQPDTLFVIRAHPDEYRASVTKKDRQQKSMELIEDWLKEKGYLNLTNLYFVSPLEFISSYQLVALSKFIIVYNSTIGLEALMTGKRLLMGGKSKYSCISYLAPIKTQDAYLNRLRGYIDAEAVEVSKEEINEARALFYKLFFETSTDFSWALQNDDKLGGAVSFKDFNLNLLHADKNKHIDNLIGTVLN